MSGTYFNTIPEDIIPLVLINLIYDEGLYSLISLFSSGPEGAGGVYRKICLMIYPEMRMYPEEMNIKGLVISWKELYHSVCDYRFDQGKKIFDKYEFYKKELYADPNILCLLLYDYTIMSNPSKEMILFTGMMIRYELSSIKSYYLKYFKDLTSIIVKSKDCLLKEIFKLTKWDADIISDNEGIVLILCSEKDSDELELVYHNCNRFLKGGRTNLTETEMYKRGYIHPLH